MTNKNPYENGVDIPDFVEKNDSDIDMSVFKMNQEQTQESPLSKQEEPEIEEDEEWDEEPKKKLSQKGLVIISGTAVVILLILAVVGWIMNFSKANKLTALQSENETLQAQVANAQSTIATLQVENASLKTQIEQAQSSSSSGGSSEGGSSEEKGGDVYKFEASINVRDGAGSSNFANFSKLPDKVADQLYSNGDEVTTRENCELTVYETKKDSSGNLWGRVADSAWICINYGGEAWGTKK